MPKRPDIAALAHEAFDRDPGAVHPVRTVMRDEDTGRIVLVPVELLEANPDQPRKHFDPEALEELTASVREKGILQPVIARKNPHREGYVLIAGERRWRAAKAAGLPEVPALIRSPQDSLEIAIIENLQRENLSALEEAEALFELKQARSYNDEQLAKIIGKSRVAVTEALSLVKLPDDIRAEARMSGARQFSKTQLLQVFRAGDSEKVRSTWEALKRGEVTTTRDLERRKKASGPERGRPKHHTFTYKPEGGGFRLSLTFPKARVSPDEVRSALKDALEHLDE